MKKLFSLSIAFFVLSPCLAIAGDWLQFRGSRSNSTTARVQIPADWSLADSVAWKTPLPGRGVSSPIVVDGRIVATCSDGADQDRLIVVCVDAEAGKVLWQRRFWATGRTATHPTSAVAAPTPASDGKRIFAFFSSNDLACLDLDGDLLWYRGLAHDFPKAGNDIGMASSPLAAGDTVVVQIESQGDSFAAGIDTATGETRWRVNRPREANWSSPVLLRGDGKQNDVVLLQSTGGLTAVNPQTGETLWEFDQPCAGIASAVAQGDRVYVASRGLTALQIDANTEPRVLWDQTRLGPGYSSPVLHQGQIYSLKSGGVLNCGDVENGNSRWQLRLKGSFWATPVAAGRHLFFVNQEGLAQIVQVTPKGKGKIVHTSDLKEPVFATPAVGESAFYIRSEKHLWKITTE